MWRAMFLARAFFVTMIQYMITGIMKLTDAYGSLTFSHTNDNS
jgi:hypothetical protein